MNVVHGLAMLVACATTCPAEQVGAAHFHTGANVVLIGATVLDRHDRPMLGLSRDNFRLFEDKAEQTITYFGEEQVPVSLAIVLDTSGSMDGKISGARNALDAVLRNSNAGNEFSLITFSERPELSVSWTPNSAEIQNHVLWTPPRGRTSLLDAIRLGLAQMPRARNPRRALVILSDGGENHSSYTERQLAGLLEEADVQMYAIDISVAPVLRERSPEEVQGPDLLSRLCSRAGGRYYQVENGRELAASARQIAEELQWQYLLGYTPPTTVGDGRFHHVRLQVIRPEGAPKLSVYWRHGYHAPAD